MQITKIIFLIINKHIIYGLKYIGVEFAGRMQSILVLGLFGVVSIGVYVLLTYVMGTMNLVFGEDIFKKFIDKFKKKKEV